MIATVAELMERTGVRFGTSGARGLCTELTDRVAYAYTRGFLQYLSECGELPGGPAAAAFAGDLRPSTGRILHAAMRAAGDLGFQALNCGRIPSPALASLGFARRIPTVMVTGSHIPADRNGIKFNKPSGEVLKRDEAGMLRQSVELPDALFDAEGSFRAPEAEDGELSPEAGRSYVARYVDFFPRGCLRGLRIGVYQHSAVGRDVLVELLSALGAEVTPLGRSAEFVPVDTEAIRPEDVALAHGWAREYRFDAVVSADGDSDRPLISDEHGHWIRGDVAGVLCARFLGADSVSTPVSCNSVVERTGWFTEVRRTRIGSPFVVSSMLEASAQGRRCVVGYEANGGFLLNSPVERDGRMLAPLPTRDAVIVHLALLLLARQEGRTLSGLVGTLPPRFTASGLVRECPKESSDAFLARFPSSDPARERSALATTFREVTGGAEVTTVDRTDGLRVTFHGGEILHLRASGNAPEFRCYTEAGTEARAQRMIAQCLELLTECVRGGRTP